MDEARPAPPTPTGHNVSLPERAFRIRRNALRMAEVQGQGYIAQALGVADVLAVSYFHALAYRPGASCCPSATTPSRSMPR
jgi:transketolase